LASRKEAVLPMVWIISLRQPVLMTKSAESKVLGSEALLKGFGG